MGVQPPLLYTIGYERATLEEVSELLHARGVTLLVDVRDSPRSRKQGFSKRGLEAAMAARRIGYEHWKELGAPPEMRRALREGGDRAAFLAAYAAGLAAREEVLDALGRRLVDEAGCLLCFERDPNTCHRSLVAERMLGRGLVRAVGHLEP